MNELKNVHVSQSQAKISDLIKDCIRGNTQAQLDFYRRFHQSLYVSALRILNDTQLAEDVMQESFLIIFKKLKSLESAENLLAWMKRIVINKSLDHWKQIQKNREQWQQYVWELEKEQTLYTNVDFVPLNMQVLHQALTQLSEQQNLIIKLYYFEDFSHQQIAEALHVSVSNSRVILLRAKQKLKELLSDHKIPHHG